MITIHVDFNSTFHGTDRQGKREWPPSPARLYSALVAGCHNAQLSDSTTEAIRAVLREVERSASPDIFTGQYRLPEADWTDAFVAKKPSGLPRKSASVGQLTKMQAKRAARLPEPVLATRVTYVVDVSSEHAELLDKAAAAVGYFGTSMDGCIMKVVEGDDSGAVENAQRWVGVENPAGQVRTWQPGFGAALDKRFEEEHQLGAHVPTVPARQVSYLPDHRDPQNPDNDGWIPLTFNRTVKDTRRISASVDHVRSVAGCDGDVFPLVNADPEHGNGALMGVAVRGIPAAHRLLQDENLGLRYDPADRRVWTRLSSYFAVSQRWRTAVPIYGPADRTVAAAYLEHYASKAGVHLLSHQATSPRLKGCAPMSMPFHPRGFVPYAVTVETPTPETRPTLTTDSLFVPVGNIGTNTGDDD
ncbi:MULTISPECIES: type I-G CRISPR-associated protein Csb2 [Corynebacterium]|uniref:type I-G CRISPR-associated protein Csb2 n=1 Tax=Corynebacterium TaxID=1716 RepID=UPI00124C132C|nr:MULTISPECIES: type I-U CRISPR-associated protein Csb2 [Corynebacterium]